MHRLFQNFIDRLSSAMDADALRDAMSESATALDLPHFAYLTMPRQPGFAPRLISDYPTAWTDHYLKNHYERSDPVIIQALSQPEPFEWGIGIQSTTPAKRQQNLFEEAAYFGIRYGFTVPIHDNHGAVAAMTFAADQQRQRFERSISEHARVLQLMAMYFHASARRRMDGQGTIDGVSLSPRELECLKWAAQGKSAWEIGRILGISRHTSVTYLENAKAKLGVRTVVQAVARLSASRSVLD